ISKPNRDPLLVGTTIRIDRSSRFCSLSAFGAGMSFAAFFTCETPRANRPRRQLSGSPQDREFSADWFRRFFSRKIVWAPAALSASICPISSLVETPRIADDNHFQPSSLQVRFAIRKTLRTQGRKSEAGKNHSRLEAGSGIRNRIASIRIEIRRREE